MEWHRDLYVHGQGNQGASMIFTHDELDKAIQITRPGASFALKSDGKPIENFNGLQWLEKSVDEGGQEMPNFDECASVIDQARSKIDNEHKANTARETIDSKRDLALRKLICYVAKDPNAPSDLKALAADIAAAEADLEPEK